MMAMFKNGDRFPRSSDIDDFAFVDYSYPIRELFVLAHVMGRQRDGQIVFACAIVRVGPTPRM
jgi:hypothetical protein